MAFLGQDTPLEDVAEVARTLEPALVVVTATVRERLASNTRQLSALAEIAPRALAGDGADAVVAEQAGGRLLEGDRVAAADALVSG